jgi:hypothetical protein
MKKGRTHKNYTKKIFTNKYFSPYMQCSKKVNGKAIPIQAWTGPEGSRRLRLPDFKTIDI